MGRIMNFPFLVEVSLRDTEHLRVMIEWLCTRGHLFNDTIQFGESRLETRPNTNRFHALQPIYFSDRNEALIFKLAWGGDV